MKNIYYTPDISEFHVGFEYERLYGNEWLGDDPFPEMAGDHCIENMESLIDKDLIRVKYLDQSDIESLGFRYFGWREGEHIYIDEKTNARIYNFAPNEYSINSKFRGIIKNKSELKKLLNQLEIKYNE